MVLLKVLGILLGCGCLVWMLYRLCRQTKRRKALGLSALFGLLALCGVCVAGRLGAEMLHLNWYTLTASAVLGVPGVILMVLLHLIWGL